METKILIATDNKIILFVTPSFSLPPRLPHVCTNVDILTKYKVWLSPLVSKEDYICPLGLFFCAGQQSRARELAVSPGLKPAPATSIRG